MAKNKLSEKYNESCIKIFSLISMFMDGDALFADVIQLFANSDGEITQKSNVLLNKYLNTLELFGITVEKSKGKYTLIKMPFTISLTEEDLFAVALVKSALSFLPNGENKRNIMTFLMELEKKYDYETRKLNVVVDNFRNYDLSFYFMKFEKQIAACEQFCKDGNKVEITYNDVENAEAILLGIPIEIKYLDAMVCFSVFHPLTRQVFDIPIDKIKNIKLLRTTVASAKTCTSVVFKLKGDLAKRYKLREWETSPGMNSNGELIVENSGEDFNALILRLFRYHENCEVLTPKYLRTKIAKLVSNTLKNYDL